MQSDMHAQIDPDQSIGQQIDRMDRTIQNQQFLIQSLIKTFLKNSDSFATDDSFKKDLIQINQRYEDINEQIILETSTFSAYDTAFAQIQNRLNKIESQLNNGNEKDANMDDAEKDLLIQNMKVDVECLKEQFANISSTGESSSQKNTLSILKTSFIAKFKKLKNHVKTYQESTNKTFSSLRADLDNLEMSGQEYHQEFTRLNAKIQNFQITLNYLRDQMNISDDQTPNDKNNLSQEIESINRSIESIQQNCVLREDAQDYENKVNSIKEKLAQFPLVAAQQEKCARDIFAIQNEITQLKNNQFNYSSSISADFQSKLKSISESQQKSEETLRKVRKVVVALRSEVEKLKSHDESKLSNSKDKIVTRDIQLTESSPRSPKTEGVISKVKAHLEKQSHRCKQNEIQISKINDDINNINENIDSIFAKLNGSRRLHSQIYDSNEDYDAIIKDIKEIKKEISMIKSNSNRFPDETKIEPQSDSIVQRINQMSAQQSLLVNQYNTLISQFNAVKKGVNDLKAKIEENDERQKCDIELINQKISNLPENINESTEIPYIQNRSVALDLNSTDDLQSNEENNSSLQQLAKQIKSVEFDLNILRERTESAISSQSKLIAQFNEIVPQLRLLKDQFISHIIECQQNAVHAQTRDIQIDQDNESGDIEINIDDENSDDDQSASKSSSSIMREIKSIKSTVSSLLSKVNRIEKDFGTGEEFHPFLNQVRAEVNSLEKEIAAIRSNTPDVSTSAFKIQSNQISKLQRQVHNLKRNFEKHLILSSNTGTLQDGVQIDEEDSEESDKSLSNLIKSNATAGNKMKDSIYDAIENKIDEIKTENNEHNSNLERKVAELEKKVKKMASSNVNNSNIGISSSDEDLSERVKNLESLTSKLSDSKNALTKDINGIRSTLTRISNKLDQTIAKGNQFSQEIDDLSGSQNSMIQKESSPTRSAVSLTTRDASDDNFDKKLSQLYVQVNSYYSGMGNLSNSLKELTKKFDVLRNDVNSIMPKSPSSSKTKVTKKSRIEKNNNNFSDIDYNENEVSDEN